MRSTSIVRIAWLLSFTLVMAVGQKDEVQAQIAHSSPPMTEFSGDAPLAIVGGTLIDLRDYGRSAEDIENSTILIRNGRIERTGEAKDILVPRGARIVDAKGAFVIPGLIDGFGSIRTQGFAEAYLYEGVTTIYVQLSPSGEDGEQKIFRARPSPDVLRGAMIGGYSVDGTPSHDHPWTSRRLNEKRLSSEQLIQRIEQLASQGHRGLLIGLDVWPDQLDTIVREAHARGLVTLGEMAFTSYPYAIRAGVDSLIRSDRYQTSIDLAQDFLAYSDDPEGPGGAPGYRGVCMADLLSPSVAAFGHQLQASRTALMPILSIEANADDLNVPNPWAHRASGFVQESELDDPVGRKTGEHPYLKSHSPEKQKTLRECAFHREDLDGRFYALGAHFLAASGSPAFGIMPGAGLHGEMKLLQRIGLSPREALAAATNNYSNSFGWHDRGLIEKNRRADIVVLRSDPRKDIEATEDIETVILGGVVIPRDEMLDQRRKHSEVH